MSLPDILQLFLTDGAYEIGKAGKIVVPEDLDFEHRVHPEKSEYFQFFITQGHPYFQGSGIVKFLADLGGRAKLLSIDVHRSCRHGEFNIQSWKDWPFEITR